MKFIDGTNIDTTLERDCDVVIVGSGPAGATVARDLARQGCEVVVVEAGPWIQPDEFPDDMFESLKMMFREMASSLTSSWPPIPVLQGVAVGGSSVINGAICWRLPEYVYREWCAQDPELEESMPWERISSDLDEIEEELHVGPTDWEKTGRHNQLMAEGAEKLGYEHKPTHVNVRGSCEHGMRGCRDGNKMSMDRTYIPEACRNGALVVSSTTVREILRDGDRATGVRGLTEGGGELTVRADRGVVMAASAIQTPALLLHNGIDHGPVGENLQAHPGSSVMALFDEKVEMWRGVTQGHETTEFRDEGIKMETLGYNPTLAVMRMKTVGRDLAREVARLDRWMNGGAAIRARARGSVRAKANGEAKVYFTPTEDDFLKLRRGVGKLGEVLLAAGAKKISLGMRGWHDVTSRDELERFQQEGPTDAESYEMIISHMFGTAKMGSDPEQNVVGADFEHHTVDRLFVADSSVFPSNIGVNPQISIIALARQCARKIL